MKVYKSKLNIKFRDYWWKLLLWMIAVVCTLGFAAVLFWLWAMKVVLDNVEVEVHDEDKIDKTKFEVGDLHGNWENEGGSNLGSLPDEGCEGGHY